MSDSAAKLEGLVRSLNLIPYLRKHPDATPMEIARDLGGSHEDIMADLTRLTLSGVETAPGSSSTSSPPGGALRLSTTKG